MSFGFSVGDLKAAFDLAQKVRDRWKDAPIEYGSIRSETENLSKTLSRVVELVAKGQLKAHYEQDLERAGRSCLESLRVLDESARKHLALYRTQSLSENQLDRLKHRLKTDWHRIHLDQDSIRRQRDRLGSAVSALNAVYNTIILDTVSATHDRIVTLSEGEEARERSRIADWLAPVDFAILQNDYLMRRHSGTNDWFLNEPTFLHWQSNVGVNLLCHGAPGSGKSVMAATVIDHLRARFSDDRDSIIVYHYCDYRRPDAQTCRLVFASLVRQLFQELSILPNSVKRSYHQHRDRFTRPSEDDLNTLFGELVAQYRNVFLVVDALDEFPSAAERIKLVNRLYSLQQRRESNINIFLTSRDIPEITRHFPGDHKTRIRAQDQDVKKYLKARLPELVSLNPENLQVQNDIVQKILQISDGMFLLAKLLFDSLEDKLTPKAIHKTLDQLSGGATALQMIYATLRDRIERQAVGRRDLARKVLYWIAYSEEELTIDELQEAVAIEPGMQRIDREDLVRNDDLISVCAGLVAVDLQNNVVRLVHKTAQEYLLTVRDEWLPSGHAVLLSSCLAYMSMSDFALGCSSKDTIEALVVQYHLLEYAASNWGHHYSRSSKDDSKGEVMNFLHQKANSSFAAQILVKNNISINHTKEVTALHLVACFAIPDIAKSLLMEDVAPNDKDDQGKTALIWAAIFDNATVAKALVAEEGTDLNVQDIDCWTALSYAAALGHVEVVEVLLQQQSLEVNALDAQGHTALHWAVKNNNCLEVTTLLLRHNHIDVNTTTRINTTPLSDALCCGNLAVVHALLKKGANMKSEKSIRGFVMHWLAKSIPFSPQLSTLLLDQGDALETTDSTGATPLHAALQHGSSEAVCYLLEKQASVMAKDFLGRNALHFAAMSSFQAEDKTILMLQHGMDVLDLDHMGCTPLHYASKKSTVKLLYEKGVNVNVRNRKGRTALDTAVSGGRDEAVEGILSLDASQVNAADSHGQTSLHIAVRGGDLLLMALLLQAGASPNVADEYGWTPLHKAVTFGRCESVKELIARHADPHLADFYGRSAYDYMSHIPTMKREVGHLFPPPPNFHAKDSARALRARVHDRVCYLLGVQTIHGLNESHATEIAILGRQLMCLGNVEDAITAFQERVVESFADKTYGHWGIICDLCERHPVKGSRWICKFCPDTDLCAECLRLYGTMTNSSLTLCPGCIGHDFLEVPGSGWSSRPDSAVNDQGESVLEWLQRLKTNFETGQELPIKVAALTVRTTSHLSRKLDESVASLDLARKQVSTCSLSDTVTKSLVAACSSSS